MTLYDWYLVGRCAGVIIFALAGWLADRAARPRPKPRPYAGRVTLPPRTYTDCPRCGRDDVAVHTMSDGMCGRCAGIMRDARLYLSASRACVACGAEDGPFKNGLCMSCWDAGVPERHLWELSAYGRGDGYHYARRRSDDGVERHHDGEPCACPNASLYGS